MVAPPPRRGEIYWTELNPVVGSEMGKTRPALVVQNDTGNTYAETTIIVTISSRQTARQYPFLVAVPEGMLAKPSMINCAHVRTVDRARLKSGPIARLDSDTMLAVDEALRASLGLV